MDKNALLATDMDGTVIPLESGPERDAEIVLFNQLMAKHPRLSLAYVTGRHLDLGLAGVKKYQLPLPDIFVCDVGTTIYLKTGDSWEKDSKYRAGLCNSWQGLTGDDVAGVLAKSDSLVAQEPEKQEEFKQSYYVDLKIPQERVTAAITEVLQSAGLSANIIYSVDTIKKIGLVDVLPPIAAKDHALQYLWQKLALKKDDIVYAGDSGNDLLAFVSGFNAIVVANTEEGVKEEVLRLARQKKIESRLYFAAQRFVAGVIEGCYHFKIFK